MKTLPTSPQSPAEIVGSGLTLGVGVFGKLFLAASLIAFIQLLPSMDLALLIGNVEVTPAAELEQMLSAHHIAVLLAALFLVLLVQGMAIVRLDHLAQSQAGNYQDEWWRGLKAFLPLVGALLLSVAIGILGGLLGALVGLLLGFLGSLLFGKLGFTFFYFATIICVCIYMAVYLLFIQWCIMLEGKGPIEAINRSFQLVYGRWWRPFAVLLIILLLFVLMGFLFGIVAVPAVHALSGPETGRSILIVGVVQMIVSALITPLYLSIHYILYRDLRLRSFEV